MKSRKMVLMNLFSGQQGRCRHGEQTCDMVGGGVQFSSVSQSCPTLCDPMNRSTPGLPVHHQLQEFTQTHVHRVVMPSSHLILCHPLLFLPPIPPSIRVFSNESTLCMRWPKYWSFSFSFTFQRTPRTDLLQDRLRGWDKLRK